MDHLLNEKQEMSEDKLEKLSKLVMQQKQMEGPIDEDAVNRITGGLGLLSIQTIEEILKFQKKKLEILKRELIPSILNECGFNEIRLKTGEKVIVEDKVKASISKAKMEQVIKNMIQLEMDKGMDLPTATDTVLSMFKDTCVVETTDELIRYLLAEDIIFDHKKEIHHQTLSKYCRNVLEQGLQIPEGISVFQYQETKLK
jgi:hypothetical protein